MDFSINQKNQFLFNYIFVRILYNLKINPMQRICGTRNDSIESMAKLSERFKSYKEENDENFTQQELRIGVIVHICCKFENKIEIDKDVNHLIEVINKDFNLESPEFNYGKDKYNHNPEFKETYDKYMSLATKSNITFTLVGTVYKKLSVQRSSNLNVLDKNIKNASKPIRPEQFLNIWVVDLSNSLLGYAQFPWEDKINTDGVVIASDTFGRNPKSKEYNLNKTTVHEIGHVLGLYHIFQETTNYDDDLAIEVNENAQMSGDCIDDTPPQTKPTHGNPYENTNVWPSTKIPPNGELSKSMFMNYLDYTYDIALCMFTKDQVKKMRKSIKIYRSGLLHNEKIIAIHDFDNDGIGFSEPVLFINSKSRTFLLNNNTVQYSSNNYNTGSKCLRTSENGKAEFKINLDNFINSKILLSVFVLANNPRTVIQIATTHEKNNKDKLTWKTMELERETSYLEYKIMLDEPFITKSSSTCYIRLGTEGTFSASSYFDNLTIREYSPINDDKISSIPLESPKNKDPKNILKEMQKIYLH